VTPNSRVSLSLPDWLLVMVLDCSLERSVVNERVRSVW
jgi:hypothetical protein